MESSAVSHFCAYLHMRNYSPHTVENYGRDLRVFFTPLAKEPREVSWRDIDAFIHHQHQAQLTATTINRRVELSRRVTPLDWSPKPCLPVS